MSHAVVTIHKPKLNEYYLQWQHDKKQREQDISLLIREVRTNKFDIGILRCKRYKE